MPWTRQEQSDLFWAGFLAGAAVGGALGVFFASELGKRAYQQLEQQFQDKFDGRFTLRKEGPTGTETREAAPTPEPPPDDTV